MSPQCRIRGLAAAITACLLVPAFCQNSTGSSNGTSGLGTKSLPPTTTAPTSNPNPTNTAQPAVPRPLRISGRVVIDDGSPLEFPATIERICNGTPHAEGYTDTQGYFSFILGQHPDVIADATETTTSATRLNLPTGTGVNQVATSPGAIGSTTRGTMGMDNRYENCELRANLSGYTSEQINLGTRTSFDNPDVGNIVIHRLGASGTATTVTATTLKAPKAARKALEKGVELARKNKPEEAISSLKEAVRVYPQFAFAWCELGKLQFTSGYGPDAHESFESAVKAEPRWPEPYLHLAVMAVQAHDWKAVEESAAHVLRLNTFQYPQAYFLHGAASFNLHHIDTAEEDALAAERLDSQHAYPQIEKLLGVIYSERHRYAEATEKFLNYLLLDPNAEDAPEARKQLANAQAMADRASRVAQKTAQQ